MLAEELLHKTKKMAVVGLGYVGLPIAHAFAKKISVIGFDTNADKVALYQCGKDPTGEVGSSELANSHIQFTAEETRLEEASFFIVAVPTPVHVDKTPDLTPIENASRIVGQRLSKGAIVVFESTVYPGVTETICSSILEQESGLRCGVDFKIGYSPERINPGDKNHRLGNIKKIVSGMDAETLETVAQVYEMVIEAGVYRASSIKVAEAAKLAENSQRDINIAFMNELSIVFHRMNIDTWDVLEAMNTKWNALGFTPGLVGGHCIGVDPYYFIYEAENLDYHSQIILAGRNINNSMSQLVAEAAIQQMALANKRIRETRVFVLGATFKENCPDLRNSRTKDIVTRLQAYGVQPWIVDSAADQAELQAEYPQLPICGLDDVRDADCLIFSVGHRQFTELGAEQLAAMYLAGLTGGDRILIDVKHLFSDLKAEYRYWSL